jgi:hypothetical protein
VLSISSYIELNLVFALALNLLLLGVPFVVVNPNYDCFHPLLFSSIMGFVGLLRRFAAYAWGLESHLVLGYDKNGFASLLAFELFLTAAGMVAYYLFFWLWRPSYKPSLNFTEPRRLRTKVLATVVIATAIAAIYIQQRGGLAAQLLSWQFGRHDELSGTFYLVVLVSLGLEACLLWWTMDTRAGRSLVFWACAITSVIVAFLMTGSRSTLIYTAIVALMVHMLRRRKIPFVGGLVVAGVVLVFLAELGDFRRTLWEGEIRPQVTTMQPLEAIRSGLEELAERSTTTSGSLPVLAEVPDRTEYLYGSSYLAILTLPIPRALWPEKPTMIGGQAGEVFFGMRAGVPIGPVAEAYWNFGTFGVIAVFALLGVFHKWLLSVYAAYRGERLMMLIYAITLLFLVPSSPGVVDYLLRLVPLLSLSWLFGIIRITAAPRKAYLMRRPMTVSRLA